jgi:hypothetical protein
MAYTLSDLMQGLPEDRQLTLAAHFCRLGLPIWDDFASDAGARAYHDSVVGMHHVISETLLARALATAQAVLTQSDYSNTATGIDAIRSMKHEFIEPIVALQDGDWELPDAVKLIFYAHSNMVEHLSGYKVFLGGEAALYVSVNQAIDALETSGQMTMPALRLALQAFTGGRAPGE